MTAQPATSLIWGGSFDHARLRTVILPRRKVLFMPMPKAACTSLLWMLADIAGYKHEHFYSSSGRAVSDEMTIHDINTWRRPHRWKDASASLREEASRDDTWLRFTTVRDPGARIWSAWQSKLLLREPAIADRFSDRPWFPRIPASAADVREDFLRFVKALAGPAATRPVDVHWAPQTDILDTAPPLNLVGHVEKLSEVIAALRGRLGPVVDQFGVRRENSSLLRYDPSIFDEESVGVINELYARDFAELGYAPLTCAQTGFRHWEADGEPTLLPAIEGYISRHRRVAHLSGLVRQRD